MRRIEILAVLSIALAGSPTWAKSPQPVSAKSKSATSAAVEAKKARDPDTEFNSDLAQFIDQAEKSGVKSEFETQAQYNDRLGKLLDKQFTANVDYQPVGIENGFSYDAELQRLTATLVGESVSDNVVGSRHDYNNPLDYQAFVLRGWGNVNPQDRQYEAVNGFGARATVDSRTHTEYSVTALNVRAHGTMWKVSHYGQNDTSLPRGYATVDPVRAQRLKSQAYWRLTFTTDMADGQKSLFINADHYYKPTIQDPIELSITGKSITVNVVKAELVDPEDGTAVVTINLGDQQ